LRASLAGGHLIGAVARLGHERAPEGWKELDQIARTLGQRGHDQRSSELREYGALGWLRLGSSIRTYWALGDETGLARRANKIVGDLLELLFAALRARC
jgi:hypothetical protein